MDIDDLDSFIERQTTQVLLELFSKLAGKLSPELDIKISFRESSVPNHIQKRLRYIDRTKSEYANPLEYLKRHYSDTLNSSDLETILTRPRLMKIDKKLGIALDNWSYKNEERKEAIRNVGYLTTKEFNDIKLARRILETKKKIQYDRTDPSSKEYANLMSSRKLNNQ